VKKLRAARDRKRDTGAKVEGRKSHAETNPEMVDLARRLRRYNRLSLRGIAARLAEEGYNSGKPFQATTISRMLAKG
jgi:hypothetical protein